MIAEKLTTIAENQQKVYDAGFEKGKQAEYDRFWDAYQGRYRLHYSYAFAYGGWTDANYNPKYPIDITNPNGITCLFFWNSGVTDTKVPITANGSCSNAFANAAIVRIPKLIFRGATNVNNMFLNASKLEELYCEGEITLSLSLAQSTKLNRASIESIINALSDTVTGQTLTLSNTAVENAFYDEEAGISPDWYNLVGNKDNWTIDLV